MRQRIGFRIVATVLAAVLAACGGHDGDSGETSALATLGSDGGSTAAASGAQVLVPPGAMAEPATIRIAEDSTDAPALPAWAPAAGPVVAITPHGAEFAEPVTVRLPLPAVTLQDNQRLYIAKAQPGGEWEVLGDTVVHNGRLEAQVRSFSYFAPVVVTYVPVTGVTVLPQPYAFSSITLTCDGVPCANPELVRRIPMSVTVTPNGGLLPASCVNPRIGLWLGNAADGISLNEPEPAGSGTVFTRSFMLPLTPKVLYDRLADFNVRMICTDPVTNVRSYFTGRRADLVLRGVNTLSVVPMVVQFPNTLELAPAATLTLRGLLIGGSSHREPGGTAFTAPTLDDQASVHLERKEASDTVWRTVQLRTQMQANPTPLQGSLPWAVWGYDFDLGAVSAADNGAQFRMRACYRVPGAAAEACNIGPLATLTVVQHTAAPAFTQQPHALLVQPGQTASFSVVAAGTPAPTLQWQTRPANGAGDWADVTDGSGATTANYTTPVLQLGDSGRQYRALASNAGGQTPSETVTVSVSEASTGPSITTPPVALTVLAGSEAVFAVSATGTGPLSYQWKHDGQDVLGANGSQLKLQAVTAADAGSYVVRVSNAVGAETSTAVTLTVTAVPEPATPVAPSLLTQPAAVAVTEGNTATFGVGVSGSGPFSFQWRRNGGAIPGATAATFTLAAATTADAGNYSVVVSNGVGGVTSQAATLAVAPASGPSTPTPEAPAINAQPGSVVVAPGMGAVLAVGTQGSGPLAYQWQRDGAPLAGQTGAQLVIAAASAGDAGSYQVTVSNAAGSVTSTAAQLVLVGAPAVTTQPAAASATAGATATFGVTATGDALRYQWLRNGEAIPGASAASYTTPALAVADSGAVFGVVVYNGAGLVFSGSATLSVTAVAEPTPLMATAVAAGFGSSYAVDVNDGKVWAWGYLVDPVTGGYKAASPWATSPVQVLGLAGVSRVVVVSETGNVYALHVDGTVSAWGRNDVGQLGDGTTTERALPVKVLDGSAGADSPPIAGICQVAAGNSALAMAPCDGRPTMMVGLMSSTRFGGATGSGKTPNGALARAVPGLPGGEVTALAMPDAAANAEGGLLVAYSDNGVWAWGAQRNNSMGAGAAETVAGTGVGAVEVTRTFNPPGRLVNRIEMGRDFTLVRWSGGAVLGIGRNVEGQLGSGSSVTSRTTLDYVSSSVSLGNFSVGQVNAAALASGNVWIWGWHGGKVVDTPTQLTTGGGYAQLSLGDQHGLLIDNAGRVHAWGDGSFGALGNGQASAALPVPVMRP